MRKSFVLASNLLFLWLISIGSVASQQRYACPAYSPQVRQKVVADMINSIKRGQPRHGCKRADGLDDGECGIMQGFFLGAAGYGEVRSFNAPWSAWVGCIPELNTIKAINDQALAKDAEAKRQEAKDGERRKLELQAKENDPNHLLTRTYYDYIAIKKCFDQRQGYLTVNISEQEMALAKTAAKGIEDSIQKIDPGIDKDSAWRMASSDSDAWMTDGDQTELTLARYSNRFELDPSDRNRCQKILQALEMRFKQLAPGSNEVKKDF